MEPLTLVVSAFSGALGGTAAGAARNDHGLGVLGNSLAGIIGGGAGGAILQALGIGASDAPTDLGSIVGHIAGGGLGGGLLMAIVGSIKDVFVRRA